MVWLKAIPPFQLCFDLLSDTSATKSHENKTCKCAIPVRLMYDSNGKNVTQKIEGNTSTDLCERCVDLNKTIKGAKIKHIPEMR